MALTLLNPIVHWPAVASLAVLMSSHLICGHFAATALGPGIPCLHSLCGLRTTVVSTLTDSVVLIGAWMGYVALACVGKTGFLWLACN